MSDESNLPAHDHDSHHHPHKNTVTDGNAHDHEHGHEHEHADIHEHSLHDEHGHDHDHTHGHHGGGPWAWIATVFHLHGHSHQQAEMISDKAFLDNELGIRTVWLALVALTITSIVQIAIVLLSGSVALLADTVHNVGDGLNSIPLLIAFYLARRAATRRYAPI